MEKDKKMPNPGSDEAIEMGCKCPIMDNGHGRGYMGMKDVFIFNLDCPLHWLPPKKKKKRLNHEA